jgi:hypothetical protein
VSDPTASITLLGKRSPDDEGFRIDLQVGPPYEVADHPNEWACPVSMKPLYEDLRDPHANDSLQALCLALSLALYLLADFRDKGGDLFYETGQRFPLEAYCFGTTMGGSASN